MVRGAVRSMLRSVEAGAWMRARAEVALGVALVFQLESRCHGSLVPGRNSARGTSVVKSASNSALQVPSVWRARDLMVVGAVMEMGV
jgi:hypothetical protein